MKLENGFLYCECGLRAIHNSSIGWKCSEHGVSYSAENTWNKFKKETQEPTLCGACGQYIEKNEQDEKGFHAPTLCDANDEVCEDCDNGTDMPCVACQYAEFANAYGMKGN
jgi:hypothetical protein